MHIVCFDIFWFASILSLSRNFCGRDYTHVNFFNFTMMKKTAAKKVAKKVAKKAPAKKVVKKVAKKVAKKATKKVAKKTAKK